MISFTLKALLFVVFDIDAMGKVKFQSRCLSSFRQVFESQHMKVQFSKGFFVNIDRVNNLKRVKDTKKAFRDFFQMQMVLASRNEFDEKKRQTMSNTQTFQFDAQTNLSIHLHVSKQLRNQSQSAFLQKLPQRCLFKIPWINFRLFCFSRFSFFPCW